MCSIVQMGQDESDCLRLIVSVLLIGARKRGIRGFQCERDRLDEDVAAKLSGMRINNSILLRIQKECGLGYKFEVASREISLTYIPWIVANPQIANPNSAPPRAGPKQKKKTQTPNQKKAARAMRHRLWVVARRIIIRRCHFVTGRITSPNGPPPTHHDDLGGESGLVKGKSFLCWGGMPKPAAEPLSASSTFEKEKDSRADPGTKKPAPGRVGAQARSRVDRGRQCLEPRAPDPEQANPETPNPGPEQATLLLGQGNVPPGDRADKVLNISGKTCINRKRWIKGFGLASKNSEEIKLKFGREIKSLWISGKRLLVWLVGNLKFVRVRVRGAGQLMLKVTSVIVCEGGRGIGGVWKEYSDAERGSRMQERGNKEEAKQLELVGRLNPLPLRWDLSRTSAKKGDAAGKDKWGARTWSNVKREHTGERTPRSKLETKALRWLRMLVENKDETRRLPEGESAKHKFFR
ncbi:hypothetical protein C8R45DRAFT_1158249 [Mycena sanguinolenta]|nr:hypothetical protein C8R45DRAFT_1158249 [Mycena sanguinolenta]